MANDTVSAGSVVTLEDVRTGDKFTFGKAVEGVEPPEWIGDPEALNAKMAGKHVGDLVGVTPMGGGRYLRILSIS
jgi:hypothetical protein